MKHGYFLVLISLGLFQSASAQTMKAINLEAGDKLINQAVNISIDFTSEKKPWCGLRVDWGNGKSQPVRVGHDGEEGAPTSPIKLSNTYNTAGKYNINLKGELLIRGLTGSATPCEVRADAAEIVVIDPETDTNYIEKSWTSYLGTLPTLHLQCIQVGLAASDIKYEARVESDQLVSMNAPGSKRVMERCQSFVKATHPKPNVACRVKGDMGLQESSCDQAYGQKMEDGAFRTITTEEAIKLHIQSKPWILGQRETPAGKEARLASEIILREKEKQRILEAAMAERRLIKDQWVNYLSKINIVQLKCMQIGISDLDIKYESLNYSDKLTSLTAPVAKQLTERCAAFGAAKHPQSNVACKINNGMGSQESRCDEYYAEKQQDGTFKKITLEEASRAQIQGKLWLVAQEENPASQQARIANELVLREKEEALLRMWKDAGFAASQLPSCPLIGTFDNCFGSGEDSIGNEYIGEFNNNFLISKGIINYKNGDRYIGEYQGGLDGEGINYYLAENQYKGMIFVARYKNNVQAGDGIFFDRNGNVVGSGLYKDNKLIEYRFVDPATFTRIPAGKIPVISSDARLKIEAKQAEIAKEQAEKQRVAAQAEKEAVEKVEKAAAAETSGALENLGIKRIAYCAALFTQAGQFFTGAQKKLFEDKTDEAFSRIRKTAFMNSLYSDKATEIANTWYQEKVDSYAKAIKSKYTKADGGLDIAFLKLIEVDYSECSSNLESLAAKENLAKKEAAEKAAIAAGRLTDEKWARIYVDQEGAESSHRKRQDFILSGLNFAINFPRGGFKYIKLDRDGYRSASLTHLTSGSIGEWKVDCNSKLLKIRDMGSKDTIDSIAWTEVWAGTIGASIVMNICLLPSQYRGY